MQELTITSSLGQRSELAEEVSALLKRGWRFEEASVEAGTTVRIELIRDPARELVYLEEDILEIVDANRGTSTRQDYVNTVIPLGIKVLKSWLNSFDAAISPENMKEES